MPKYTKYLFPALPLVTIYVYKLYLKVSVIAEHFAKNRKKNFEVIDKIGGRIVEWGL